MRWLIILTGYLAPVFIIMSPVLSYSDQAYSMHCKRSSAGFSLDIPLIMLVASVLKIFYWLGAHFDKSLLLHAVLMIILQAVLLKVALDHRPLLKGGIASAPLANELPDGGRELKRPLDFWQWQSPKPYWQFLLYLFVVLAVLELVLSPMPSIYVLYYPFIGYLGLGVEALLPLPQIAANERAQSCSGFRPSVLIGWLVGDAIKILWFFTATTHIPSAFKLCAIFQTGCDFYLCLQFHLYGSAPVAGARGSPVKDHDLAKLPTTNNATSFTRNIPNEPLS